MIKKPVITRNTADGFLAHLSRRLIGELIVYPRRDVPVGVPLDLSTVMEWHELPKYNGIQVSQLI